jgi:hypothetical protein
MKRLLIVGAVAYICLMAFAVFGVTLLSRTALLSMRSYFWLFGPPATLVYGTELLWAFISGTVIVASLFVVVARTRSPIVRGVCGVALALAWVLFGAVAYIPSA